MEGIKTAKDRLEILEYIVSNHAALYVDQAAPLNYCGLGEIDLLSEDDEELGPRIDGPIRHMEAPLLIDMQTANAMRVVRNALNPANQAKFDRLSWTKAGKISWGLVK